MFYLAVQWCSATYVRGSLDYFPVCDSKDLVTESLSTDEVLDYLNSGIKIEGINLENPDEFTTDEDVAFEEYLNTDLVPNNLLGGKIKLICKPFTTGYDGNPNSDLTVIFKCGKSYKLEIVKVEEDFYLLSNGVRIVEVTNISLDMVSGNPYFTVLDCYGKEDSKSIVCITCSLNSAFIVFSFNMDTGDLVHITKEFTYSEVDINKMLTDINNSVKMVKVK